MLLRISSIFLLLSLLTSCGNKEVNKMTILHDQVMEIHDEIMPQMSTINKLKKQIRSLNEDNKTTERLNAIADLTAADDAMMDWMAAYKKPKENTPESISYLNNQMKKIAEVKTQMTNAINNAKAVVDVL